mmetsp:Transcript_11864/g.16423  ORF Transcript_11864/g.16423 Transcript_11864/m.16423 type:complete len:292 (+) Transcript_11864:60-935(+)
METEGDACGGRTKTLEGLGEKKGARKAVKCRALIVHPLFSNSKRIEAISKTEYKRSVAVRFIGIPLVLDLAQYDLFGSKSVGTGGTLWYVENILAEYVIRRLAKKTDRFCAIELGCGASPVAGMALWALGLDVVFTDLKECLNRTRENLRRNASAVLKTSRLLNRAPGKVHVEELMWGTKDVPREVAAHGPFDLILCSDCIYQRKLHPLLVQTLSTLLTKNNCCMLAYQTRDSAVERAFFCDVLAKTDMKHKPISIKDIVKEMLPLWPLPMQEFLSKKDPDDYFKVYSISL